MLIEQVRIRNIDKLVRDLDFNSKFVLGIKIDSNIEKKLFKKLNIIDLNKRQLIFPSPILGIMSERNSVGEYIVQNNKEKEVAYRKFLYNLTDRDGYNHSGIANIAYERYPREFIKPKEYKLLLHIVDNGCKHIYLNNIFQNNNVEYEDIKFAANLFLEIFGIVDTFSISRDHIFNENKNIKIKNWENLNQDEEVWKFREFKCSRNKLSNTEKALIKSKYEHIIKYNPDSIAKGVGGYFGYIGFEFKDKGICILDSIAYGNDTYIFEGNWNEISKMTKKDILKKGNAKEKISNGNLWSEKISKYIG